MIDPQLHRALRAATPGLADGVHLNHAGASLMPQAAHDAIAAHLALEARHGPMDAAAMVADRLSSLRESAARLIHASACEIAIMPSASHAFGSVFAALPPLRAGERILVSRQEWGGNLATYRRAADRSGARVEVMPVRDDGSVDPVALAGCLDERVRLISLTWLPANGGLIHDAAAVGSVARAAGIPFLVDAGQALGQIPVDVRELQCDILKGAGRKFLRGPRGTALLYVRREFLGKLDPPWVDVWSAPWGHDGPALRGDARMFETSESSAALQLGLLASIELALSLGVARIAPAALAMAERLRAMLGELPGVTVRDLGRAGARSGLVSFTIEGLDAMAVKDRLRAQRIHVGANGVPYTPLDMQARGLHNVVRASVSYLNDTNDLETLAGAIRGIAAQRSRRA